MDKAKYISFASVISELQQSEVFMTVKARILETPKANLNGVSVTSAFVDDIIANEERYVGLPLYADLKALKNGRYNNLGHLYDARTGEFHSTQIGSFYAFEKEEFDGGAYLVGYARIPKREKGLSRAIAELFAEGNLKFSFEITCGDYTEENGIITIDKSENNYLEGTAIVTLPACEDAVALDFVAQQSDTGDVTGGEEEMHGANKTEQVAELEQDAMSAGEPESKPEADKETAAVYVTEATTVTTEVHAYDSETGVEAHDIASRHTETMSVEEGNLVQTDSGIAVAEADNSGESGEIAEAEGGTADDASVGEVTEGTEGTEGTESTGEAEAAEDGTETVEETVEEAPDLPADMPVLQANPEPAAEIPAEDPTKKTAEILAELVESVKQIKAEIESLKETKAETIVAEQKVVAEITNPFIDSITAEGNEYSLLKPEVKSNHYTLL